MRTELTLVPANEAQSLGLLPKDPGGLGPGDRLAQRRDRLRMRTELTLVPANASQGPGLRSNVPAASGPGDSLAQHRDLALGMRTELSLDPANEAQGPGLLAHVPGGLGPGRLPARQRLAIASASEPRSPRAAPAPPIRAPTSAATSPAARAAASRPRPAATLASAPTPAPPRDSIASSPLTAAEPLTSMPIERRRIRFQASGPQLRLLCSCSVLARRTAPETPARIASSLLARPCWIELPRPVEMRHQPVR
jgi:hypothetical protein